MTVTEALAAFGRNPAAVGWLQMPFFTDGTAERVAAEVDACLAAGAQVLPAPANVFNALTLTPFEAVKVVVLGQDPYPRPGDAHGLAFSYVGQRRLPASLKAILAEMAADLGCAPCTTGDLSAWARQGVLLLNTALTTEAGCAGAHLKLGWSALADQAVAALSAQRPAVVFMLWGAPARQRADLVDRAKHLVIESGHPSPLNTRRDFAGTRPFSRANAWLVEHGLQPVEWRLPRPGEATRSPPTRPR
jgi:uracil-DNA glycosylase